MTFIARPRLVTGAILTALGLALGSLAVPAASAAPALGQSVTQARSVVRPVPVAELASTRHWAAPPTTAECIAKAGVACYAPTQLQRAYHLKPLYAKGLTGAGSTIVIVDAFGSPTAKADLHKFSQDFGLPDPPCFRVIQPAGHVPAFDPKDPVMAGWAEETSLDVQWAHAMAPGANILLVETPVPETEGVEGFPEIVRAENYVIDHHLGDVISQSFGATEDTFPSAQSLLRLRSAFKNAARHHVTVLASSGDAGPTNAKLNGDLYKQRVNSWPSSDPLVTSVGGTQLHLDAQGKRTQPDNVWNDTALLGGPAASGGGRSKIFARPGYQDGVKSVVHQRRGTPDISMSAAVDGGVLVWIGFTGGDGITPGYHIFGGTSESAPELAGIVAIAKQRAHHRLGLLNPRLYRLGRHDAAGIVDVTRGDTTVTFSQNGQTYTVPGFAAVSGYDLATGLGTVNAEHLTKELAR